MRFIPPEARQKPVVVNTSLGHDLLQPKLIVTSRIKPELIVSSSCANWE